LNARHSEVTFLHILASIGMLGSVTKIPAASNGSNAI
jgi:hypothetical protein